MSHILGAEDTILNIHVRNLKIKRGMSVEQLIRTRYQNSIKNLDSYTSDERVQNT